MDPMPERRMEPRRVRYEKKLELSTGMAANTDIEPNTEDFIIETRTVASTEAWIEATAEYVTGTMKYFEIQIDLFVLQMLI